MRCVNPRSRRAGLGLTSILLLLAASFAPGAGRAVPEQSPDLDLGTVVEAIRRLEFNRARAQIDALPEKLRKSASASQLMALIDFNTGDYDRALTWLDRSIASAPRAAGLQSRRALRDRIQAAVNVTRDYVQVRSPDGRFLISHAPGKDALLVPHAFEVLTRADRQLRDFFDVKLEAPIRLEIYPGPDSLAEVSSLTRKHIDTSGTVALCKWNRLMVTSPRALVRGYPWMDTIAHELVHLVLMKATSDRAPVWLQEGTAKLLERSWRDERPSAHLEPAVASLLGEALRDDKLIPFERLHPSIAMLPSQRDAGLAFAQVATFMEQFLEQHGQQGMRTLMTGVANDRDVREVLSDITSLPFELQEDRWRAEMAVRYAKSSKQRSLGKRFRSGDAHSDDSLDIPEEAARRFVRLGDMLWERDRQRAAAHEYARAGEVLPEDPIIAARLARSALGSDAPPAPVIEALHRALQAHPSHAPLHALMGRALLAAERPEQALESLREVIRINPFDPVSHCRLATIGDTERERQQASATCLALGGK